MHTNTLIRWIGPVAMGLMATVAWAGEPPSSAAIDKQNRGTVVEGVGRLFAENYYDPSQGQRIRKQLTRALQAGRFNDAQDAEALAGELSAMLSGFDKHAHVIWAPGAMVDGHEDLDWEDISRRSNHGVERIEHLPGNVMLLRLRSLPAPEIAGDTLAAAMRLLANADAIILDLRNNGGGEPGAVQMISSYFIGPEPVQIDAIYWRARDTTQQYWTMPRIEGKGIYDTPLFVLAGPATGSAAESLTLGLKSHKRATVIGQNTFGAANPGRYFEAPLGFHAFVSYGHASNAVTGESWEGDGVAPDVRTQAGQEREEALLLAWSAILKTATDPEQIAGIQWARERAIAIRGGHEMTAEDRTDYLGAFGDRRVVELGDGLAYVRGTRAASPMRSAGGDVFYLDDLPDVKLIFERNDAGRVERLIVTYVGGHREPNTRNP